MSTVGGDPACAGDRSAATAGLWVRNRKRTDQSVLFALGRPTSPSDTVVMEVKDDINKGAGGPADRLLEVADRLFYERGFAATGIGELIKEAGVARSSFYQHFPSKEDLVVAYLERRHKTLFEMINAEIEKHRSPLKRALALFDCLAAFMEASSFRGCAFMNAAAEFSDKDSAPRQVILNTKTELRSLAKRLCKEAGNPDVGDEIFMLVEGATAASVVMCELWPIATARKSAMRRLQAGAVKKKTGKQ